MPKINIDISQIQNLLEQEKFAEAKLLLEQFFGQELTSEERGSAYLNVAEMYMDIATHFNQQKRDLLKSALDNLSDFDKKGNQLDDMIQIAKVREDLK
jgi:hypothetical protein